MTEVTAVPAWEPVLIEASRGNYQAEIPASVEGFPGDENGLQVNGGTPIAADGTYYKLKTGAFTTDAPQTEDQMITAPAGSTDGYVLWAEGDEEANKNRLCSSRQESF